MLSGVAAAIFGILAIVWPSLSLATMTVLFGVYAIVAGVVAIAGLFNADSTVMPWFFQLLVGVAGLAAGVIAFTSPRMTTVALLGFVAAFAVVTGLGKLISAIQQRGMPGAGGLGVSGSVSILFGALMITRPEAGALAVAWLIGVYAILDGAGLITMGSALYGLRTGKQRLAATFLPAERAEKAQRTRER